MKIDEIVQAKFKNAQQKAIVNLRITSNLIGQKQNAFMEPYGLTLPQFNILRILRGANETLNVNTIKDRMIEKSPNTTRLMDKLIDKQLIDRVRCEEDRRVVYVTINKNGLALLEKIDEDLKLDNIFENKLSESDALLLSDLLDKLRNSFD